MRSLIFLFASLPVLLFISCGQPHADVSGNTDVSPKDQLRKALSEQISKYNATVGLSVVELESGDTLSIGDRYDYPMQSVFKFPLALKILDEVQKGNLSLEQKILLQKEMLDHFSYSPLKRQNPGSNFMMSVDSLLMYTISYSDNLSCDELFKLAGGTDKVDAYVHRIGFPKIHIKYTELEMGAEENRMYQNSTRPTAMTALLKEFYEGKVLDEANTRHLLDLMTNDSTTHQRILGDLPSGTRVAHKTGTSHHTDTFINACNDIGILYLPNGKHVALSVFVMNAHHQQADIEKLIAVLSKQVYDHYK